jgi:hypothetical protein
VELLEAESALRALQAQQTATRFDSSNQPPPLDPRRRRQPTFGEARDGLGVSIAVETIPIRLDCSDGFKTLSVGTYCRKACRLPQAM